MSVMLWYNKNMDNREDILKEAENLKRTKGRIDIVELANTLGIKVYSTKDIKQPSFIAFDPQTQSYEIYFNSKDAGTRQRFSIAHEIAHYILHRDKIVSFGVVGRNHNNSLSISEEKEADCLAGALLMPANSVSDFIHNKGITLNDKIELETVKDMAKEFEVSLIAAALRLRELGYYVGYIEI